MSEKLKVGEKNILQKLNVIEYGMPFLLSLLVLSGLTQFTEFKSVFEVHQENTIFILNLVIYNINFFISYSRKQSYYLIRSKQFKKFNL